MTETGILNEIWKKILGEEITRWVIFKHGTIVTCRNPEIDCREYATDLMKTMGPVWPGTSHGDFNVNKLEDILGWVVQYHHEDILNYVGPEELDTPDSPDFMIGLIGRKKRADDAQELEIVHVELNTDSSM
jgi:hypothetical protein